MRESSDFVLITESLLFLNERLAAHVSIHKLMLTRRMEIR